MRWDMDKEQKNDIPEKNRSTQMLNILKAKTQLRPGSGFLSPVFLQARYALKIIVNSFLINISVRNKKCPKNQS